LELAATDDSGRGAVVELYGPNQRSGGALRQFWRWLVLRDSETAPLQTSMHRAVEHRALMTIAAGDLGVANTATLTVAGLDRGWTMFSHTPPRGTPLDKADAGAIPTVWESLAVLQRHQISHGDLRPSEITVDDAGTALFGGFGNSEYGATEEHLQSDIAQLLLTTTATFGAEKFEGDFISTPCPRAFAGCRSLGAARIHQPCRARLAAPRTGTHARAHRTPRHASRRLTPPPRPLPLP
jgi:hypothetical protein